jgi:hypothetical protein
LRKDHHRLHISWDIHRSANRTLRASPSRTRCNRAAPPLAGYWPEAWTTGDYAADPPLSLQRGLTLPAVRACARPGRCGYCDSEPAEPTLKLVRLMASVALRSEIGDHQISITSEHAKARRRRNTNQSPALKPKCRVVVVLCKNNVVTGGASRYGALSTIDEGRFVFMRCSAQRRAHAQDRRCG